jgi:hypothetical protein
VKPISGEEFLECVDLMVEAEEKAKECTNIALLDR